MILAGEWWIGNVSQILADAIRTGGEPAISDAFTINRKLGALYVPCSTAGDTYTTVVQRGKTYLLRVINAAVNNELFFAVAGHNLTVVGTEGSYTKPWTRNHIMITPGQTMDLLLKTDQGIGLYYMAAKAYSSTFGLLYNIAITTAILQYKNVSSQYMASSPSFPTSLPDYDDSDAVTSFTAGLRSLASKQHPVDVPQTVDKQIGMTASVKVIACPNATCQGPNGERLAASLNNISFVEPSIDVLDAYYRNISGVYGNGFPDRPPVIFNFTDDNLPTSLLFTSTGTEVRVLEYNTSVEVVFQGTNLLAGENHLMHLHGQSFHVVGHGFGNYDNDTDPASYNLVDPPYENTVGVPKNGWAAVRFRATNPGVWFMHCHLDRHNTWGMDVVFIVKNGATTDAQMLPPPSDMPTC